MKLAILIRAHRSPDQLARLVRALRHDSITVHLHIDKKVSQAPFEEALADESVHFVRKRHDLTWGGFSMVRATQSALREMRAHWGDERPDYVALLSGQDYPIMSNARILDFLEKNTGREFISYAPLPTPFWGDKSGYRTERYHLIDLKPLTWPLNKTGELRSRWPFRLHLGNKLATYLPSPKVPDGYTLHGGSAWWCLSVEAIDYILSLEEQRKDVFRFFRWTLHPDEMFYQTVLMNSEFADRLGPPFEGTTIGDELWFQIWADSPSSPNVLKAKDLSAILASGKLFARKFDPDEDSEILDLLDEARAQGA